MTMFSNIMSAFFVINCLFSVECFEIYVVLQFFAVFVVVIAVLANGPQIFE